MFAEHGDHALGDPTQEAQPWGILEAVSMSISIVMLAARAQGLKFL